jgi:hypothetical protein
MTGTDSTIRHDPETQRFVFDDPQEGRCLEFRLVYKGYLPSAQNHAHVDVKHRIRKDFHLQLKELWNVDPSLKRQLVEKVHVIHNPMNMVIDPGKREIHRSTGLMPGGRPWVDHVADNYSRCGFRFVPLVREENGLTCALEILFLRYGHPGDLIRGRGDIDNRMKILFDALKVPTHCNEVTGQPEEGEEPFFCLLEDDSLITSAAITTDRLLTPKRAQESDMIVDLVVHVKIVDPAAILGSNGFI